MLKFGLIGESSSKKLVQTPISKNLAFLLTKENISISQLAVKLEIPVMTIRRILSGETEDPRISTVKLIADFFKISVDLLIKSNPDYMLNSGKSLATYSVPKIQWENLQNIIDLRENNFDSWSNFQTFSLSNNILGKKIFALESRPSMYPRFPRGTSFIIDPETSPEDGDIVLVKIKSNNEFTLKELLIDPPYWQLLSLISDSKVLVYSRQDHEICGVSLLTMVYNSKISS